MEKTNTAVYDRKYAEGDFNYDPDRERAWLAKHLVQRFGLVKGNLVMDLGCGKGLHAALLADMGFRVFGVEPSIEGVKGGMARGSDAIFIQSSASRLHRFFDNGSFDMIYCRGMSWFHRELDRVCPTTGVNVSEKIPYFMELIKPGGVFVLQICTDFSGTRPEGQVHNNRLSDYLNLLSPHGELSYVTNWEGKPLVSDEQAAEVKGGIVVGLRRPLDAVVESSA